MRMNIDYVVTSENEYRLCSHKCLQCWYIKSIQ